MYAELMNSDAKGLRELALGVLGYYGLDSIETAAAMEQFALSGLFRNPKGSRKSDSKFKTTATVPLVIDYVFNERFTAELDRHGIRDAHGLARTDSNIVWAETMAAMKQATPEPIWALYLTFIHADIRSDESRRSNAKPKAA